VSVAAGVGDAEGPVVAGRDSGAAGGALAGGAPGAAAVAGAVVVFLGARAMFAADAGIRVTVADARPNSVSLDVSGVGDDARAGCGDRAGGCAVVADVSEGACMNGMREDSWAAAGGAAATVPNISAPADDATAVAVTACAVAAAGADCSLGQSRRKGICPIHESHPIEVRSFGNPRARKCRTISGSNWVPA